MNASDEEILDVVDEHDHVITQAPRSEAYARRLRHRCVFVLATDEEGRIFVHRRTPTKRVFPSHYDMFVGGVVGTGESYDDAALREAQEELGVRELGRPEPAGRFLYTHEYTHEGGFGWWSAVYRLRCPRPVSPQEDEIDWHTWLPPEELHSRLDEWPWTPDSLAAYAGLLSGDLQVRG